MAWEFCPMKHALLRQTEGYTDAEFGRLCRALIAYSETGEVVELEGKLKTIFPFLTPDIDRARAAYDQKAARGRGDDKNTVPGRSDDEPLDLSLERMRKLREKMTSKIN